MNVNARHRGQNSLLYNYVNHVCDLVLVTNARYIKKLQHLKEWFVVYEAKLIQCIHKVYHQQKMRIKIWLELGLELVYKTKEFLTLYSEFEFQILMKPLKEIPISIILDIVNKKTMFENSGTKLCLRLFKRFSTVYFYFSIHTGSVISDKWNMINEREIWEMN